MLENINFDRDYGEIFEEAKQRALFVQSNPPSDELIKMAQNGDERAFEKVYKYYMPVVEFFYLKDIPWIDSDYEREELKEVYLDVLRISIFMYKKATYHNLFNCIRTLVSSHKKRGIARLQKEELMAEEIVSNEIDNVAVVQNNNGDFGNVSRIIDLIPNEDDREILRWEMDGKTLASLARLRGCSRQSLSYRRDNVQQMLKKIHRVCQSVDYQRNILNKSILQICKDMDIPRMELCYYLRVIDYISGRINIVPEPTKDCELVENQKVASCVLSIYDHRVYENISKRYGKDIKSIPKYVFGTYKEVYKAVELVKRYMRAVVDVKEGGLKYWRINGIDVGDLSKQEQEFYLRLYNYIMYDDKKPYMSPKIKVRLTERAHDIVEVLGESD